MKTFKHIHSSSRYDRSLKSLEDAVNDYMDKSSVITLTEVSAEARESVLRKVAKQRGWGTATGDLSGRDDCAILWDEKTFEKVHARSYVLSLKTYYTSSGRKTAPNASVDAVLKHKAAGKRILFSVAHLPAGVEGRNGLGGKLPRRVVAWRAAQKGWRGRWNYLANKYKTDAVVVIADWNLNLKKAGVRALFKVVQPGMRSVWNKGPFPSSGTHGTRIIDFTFIRGKIVLVGGKPKILAKNASSDHTAYIQEFGV